MIFPFSCVLNSIPRFSFQISCRRFVVFCRRLVWGRAPYWDGYHAILCSLFIIISLYIVPQWSLPMVFLFFTGLGELSARHYIFDVVNLDSTGIYPAMLHFWWQRWEWIPAWILALLIVSSSWARYSWLFYARPFINVSNAVIFLHYCISNAYLCELIYI